MTAQNINSANLILDDCEFVDISGNHILSSEINNRKNFFKQEFYQLLNGNTFGASIFIGHNQFDFIVPCLKAGWELGCNIFVHDFHVGYVEHPDFKNFYDFISLTVFPQKNTVVEIFPSSKANLLLTQYDKTVIYPDIDYNINGIITADTVAVKTHTSGTTGMPKIIDYSHKLVYQLTDNIKKLFNLTPEDRPLHWKTLHHSSLFLNYAIPLLNTCKIHYCTNFGIIDNDYTPENYAKSIFPYVVREKITRVLIPYDWIQFFDRYPAVDLGGVTSLHVIRGLNKDIAKWVLTNYNPKEIIDTFGCSEIGVMFIEKINQTNIDTYQTGHFSIVAPGLKYEFHDRYVEAGWDGYALHKIGDIMKRHKDKVIYKARNYSVLVNDETVYIDKIDQYLRKTYKTSQFQVIGDIKNNKLYLATFDQKIPTDLSKINHELSNNLSSNYAFENVKYFDITTVQSGMKPSSPILLYSFLQGSNNESTS
jgi:hypothetical protein